MHRHTGANTLHRAYSSGGSRTLIEEADDKTLMQGMKGTAMKGEARKDVESPQNYGFTSVVADAKKGKDGQIEQSAEGFMSYMGGNRSFPVCAVMDDRRHRLKNLGEDAAKGSVALHGLKEWGQQFLNTDTGMFMTGNKEKKTRIQLVENQNGKKQTQPSGGRSGGAQAGTQAGTREVPLLPRTFRTKSGVEFEIETFELDEPSVTPFADGGGSSSGGGAGGGAGGGGEQEGKSKATGQKTLHKEETDIALEQNGKETFSQHGQFFNSVRSGSDASNYHENRKKSSQATDKHVHMRFEKNRIWVDDEPPGHWSELPILQKKDKHCKE